MPRSASVALVAALLIATGVAFAFAEKLKLTPSPILGTRVTKTFSPVCGCATASASIRFRLRQADTLDVEIVRDDEVVRRLAVALRYPRGPVEFVWDGRDASGTVLPDGTYRPRVRLREGRRTIVLPNPIRLDTTPPVFEAVVADPPAFSPDGDGRRDSLVVAYRLNEPAQVSLLVNGIRRIVKRGTKAETTVHWNGRVRGQPLRRGTHRAVLSAVDAAGNGARSAPVTFVVRSVSLGRIRIAAVAGRVFAVRVSSDAERVRWRIGGKAGIVAPGTLRLRAPSAPGTYTLYVAANRGSARATVVVRLP